MNIVTVEDRVAQIDAILEKAFKESEVRHFMNEEYDSYKKDDAKRPGKVIIEGLKKLWDLVKRALQTLINAIANIFRTTKEYYIDIQYSKDNVNDLIKSVEDVCKTILNQKQITTKERDHYYEVCTKATGVSKLPAERINTVDLKNQLQSLLNHSTALQKVIAKLPPRTMNMEDAERAPDEDMYYPDDLTLRCVQKVGTCVSWLCTYIKSRIDKTYTSKGEATVLTGDYLARIVKAAKAKNKNIVAAYFKIGENENSTLVFYDANGEPIRDSNGAPKIMHFHTYKIDDKLKERVRASGGSDGLLINTTSN